MVLGAWLAAASPAQVGLAAREPSLSDVLRRAGVYVETFQQRLSGIVADEHYVQDFRPAQPSADRDQPPLHRELDSDLLLVRPPGAAHYVEYRDVYAVDGRAIRDRQERTGALLLSPSPTATDRLRRIIQEGARFNIGTVERTINTPTLALSFLLPANQWRFAFKRAAPRRQPDRDAGSVATATPFRVTAEVWAIEYRERETPTVIRSPRGASIKSRGRFFIDPTTGRVLISELVSEEPAVRASIEVSYQSAPLLDLLVPVAMRERYDVRRDGSRIDGLATYGKFRQFGVAAGESIRTPQPME